MKTIAYSAKCISVILVSWTLMHSARGAAVITLPEPILRETFDAVEEGQLPPGWTVQNFTDENTAGQDLNAPQSDSFKNWVVISRQRVIDIGAAGGWDGNRRLQVAPQQFVNGVLVTNLIENKFIYAESDVRGGSQVQFLFSPDFNLTGQSNVFLFFHSIYEQNQDSIGSVEYSIDGGTNWLPIIYMIDQDDIIRDAQANVDAVATLNAERGDTAFYVDPDTGEAKGGTYGAFIGAPITAELATFISGRVNDDPVESKRVELFRLPRADNQPKVRFRFAQAGTASWYFGVDNFGLYSIETSGKPARPTIIPPARANFFGATIRLKSSPFAGFLPTDQHRSSLWQLSASSNFDPTNGLATPILSLSSTNDLTALTTDILSRLFPGRTYSVTVQHLDQRGNKSDFAEPGSFSVSGVPTPVLLETFDSATDFGLPAGWSQTNQTDQRTAGLNPADPNSDTYLGWVVAPFETLTAFGGARDNRDVVSGKSVYAESDNRGGNQIQYLLTPDFNLSGRSHIWVAFKSNWRQNQDSFAGLECSIDQGATWLPVVYFVDDKGGNADLKRKADGSIDALATLTTTYSDVAKIIDPATGQRVVAGKFADFILAKPLDSLGPFLSGRIDDDSLESKRYERFRLTAADNQAKVRFRFINTGTGSWYWGIDDFGIFEVRPEAEPIVVETFDSTPEAQLPAGWTVESQTDDQTPGFDLNDPTSDSYKDWVVISRQRVVDIGNLGRWSSSRRLNVAPNQFFAGDEVTQLIQGNFFYAESDNRSGSQIQFLFSPDFNLTGRTNVSLVFHSIYEQNQDSLGAVEYSIDGGTSWLPILYMIDRDDIILDAEGKIDAEATLNTPRGDAAQGQAYGAFIAAPITAGLAPFISGRINDDGVESKRVEVFRLPAADNQPKVRFRFTQTGTGSWYFGIDNFGLYSISATTPPTITTQPQDVTVLAGVSATFAVVATGSTPLTFQWQKGGVNIPGATNSTLVLSAVGTNDNSSVFRVLVSNPVGSVTSSPATLTVTPAPPVVVTGQWDFDQGDLRATTGADLQFRGDTAAATVFANVLINGQPAKAMQFPAATPAQGFIMPHGAAPNGGGRFVNQYTLIMDLMFPADSTGKWRGLFQSNPNNSNDGDLFVNPANGIGISGQYHGTIAADTWYRVAFVFNLNNRLVNKYIDGVLVNAQTLSEGLDGRWSLDPVALLFSDEDNETASGFVNSIQFRNGITPDADIAALGGATAAGIPAVIGGPELTINSITDVGSSVALSWTGGQGQFVVQTKVTLSQTNWLNLLTTTNNSATLPKEGSTGFFRVQRNP